jgi:DNA-directed RNA polymerase-3 subunit RPC5
LTDENAQDGDDEDEVVAEYDVFITPESEAEQIYLIQYPTRQRTKPYNERERSAPKEMRIKPNSGFMELDIGLNVMQSFDRKKGLQWGEAIRMTKAMGVTSFGLPAGFGKGSKANEIMSSERTNPLDDADRMEHMLNAFERSVSEGKVLNNQTLGGQIIKPEPGRPMYMLGAFRKSEI